MFEKDAEEQGNKYWDCLVDSDDLERNCTSRISKGD